MEKNANYLSVELIENHLAVSFITSSGINRIYYIPVKCQNGCFYVDRRARSYSDLMRSCNINVIRRAIEDFNSLGPNVVL
jgi:hypothetical protein